MFQNGEGAFSGAVEAGNVLLIVILPFMSLPAATLPFFAITVFFRLAITDSRKQNKEAKNTYSMMFSTTASLKPAFHHKRTIAFFAA
jgi:hypothetical protein